jgi:hypothetical protein
MLIFDQVNNYNVVTVVTRQILLTFFLLLPPVTRENETMQKKCRMVTTEYNTMKENYQQKVADYKKLQKGKTNTFLSHLSTK